MVKEYKTVKETTDTTRNHRSASGADGSPVVGGVIPLSNIRQGPVLFAYKTGLYTIKVVIVLDWPMIV
jgi:hypothetical protein